MKLPFFIRSGEPSFPPHTKEIFKAANDGAYVFDFTKEKSKATASMFGYLYNYVYPEILKAMGEHRTKGNIDKLDETLKVKYGISKLTKVFELRKRLAGDTATGGEKSTVPFVKVVEKILPISKSKYTVEDMTEFWLALQQFASEFFGLVLHDPDPEWKKHWEKTT